MKNIKNIKEFNAILISIAIIIPLLGIGYLYFQLNSMYDKEEAKEIRKNQKKIKKMV